MRQERPSGTLRQIHPVCWFLSFIPLVFLAFYVRRYGIDMPYWDEWDFSWLFVRGYEKVLCFGDFWEQWNENRFLFPKIILVGLGFFTRWNIVYEMAGSVVAGAGIFAVIAYQIRATRKLTGIAPLEWLLPAVSVIVFSLNQEHNWLWGHQFSVFLEVFALTGSLLLLANSCLSRAGFFTAVLLGIVATFSLGGGLLVWPIGFGILILRHAGNKAKRPEILSWVFFSLAAVYCYFLGYERPAHHPPYTFCVQNPFEALGGFFIVIGQAIAGMSPLAAMCAGALGSVFFIFMTLRLLRRAESGIPVLLPYIALALYSFGVAVLCVVTRGGMGICRELSAKYITHSIFFWIAFLALAFLSAFGSKPDYPETFPAKRWYWRAACGVAAAAVIGLAVLGSVRGARAFSGRYGALLPAREALLAPTPENEKDLVWLYPEEHREYFKRCVANVRKYRLSLFRNQPL